MGTDDPAAGVTTTDPLPSRADAIVVGAGHNGLVAATVLAAAGLDVLVLERDVVIGGAARTEQPFPNEKPHEPLSLKLSSAISLWLLGMTKRSS